MVAKGKRPELLAIVGPTASGKSDLAMLVAKTYKSEIVTADSRTVYKGMDIGTAKPSKSDQKKVKHWGLDLVEPGRRFTAYDFKKYALSKINDIRSRGMLPILVGGTGLYVDAILFDFEFLPGTDLKKRAKLEALSVGELQQIIQNKAYKMPLNNQNKRHLIRAIEVKGQRSVKRLKPPNNALIVGIMPPNNVLKERIDRRAKVMFSNGAINETKKLLKLYGEKKIEYSGGIVYKICLRLIRGEIDAKEAEKLDRLADWQYARRQRTWFKRNPYIKWFSDDKAAYRHINNRLNT